MKDKVWFLYNKLYNENIIKTKIKDSLKLTEEYKIKEGLIKNTNLVESVR